MTRVLAAGGDAVDLQGRPLPEPLEGAVARLAEQRRRPDRRAVLLLVEVDRAAGGRPRSAGLRRRRRTRGPRRAVGPVQACQDPRPAPPRVGDGAAVAAGVQVAAGPGDDDVQGDQALGGDRQRGLVGRHMRAVGGDHQVAGQLVGVRADVGRQVRAADLLLALEQELHVQRQPAALRQHRLEQRQHQQDRALVVGDAAARARRPRRPPSRTAASSTRRVAGGLHVVVAVDETVGAPGAPSHSPRTTGKPSVSSTRPPGEAEPGGQPVGGARMVSAVALRLMLGIAT